MNVTIVGLIRDEGTVVLLAGLGPNGEHLTVAADHRPAQAILEALEAELDEPVVAEVPEWALMGSWS
jgi:hypothetical protein